MASSLVADRRIAVKLLATNNRLRNIFQRSYAKDATLHGGTGYIYVFAVDIKTNGDGFSGLLKCGETGQLKQRLAAHKKCYGELLDVQTFHCTASRHRVERLVHCSLGKKFPMHCGVCNEKHVEWFRTTRQLAVTWTQLWTAAVCDKELAARYPIISPPTKKQRHVKDIAASGLFTECTIELPVLSAVTGISAIVGSYLTTSERFAWRNPHDSLGQLDTAVRFGDVGFVRRLHSEDRVVTPDIYKTDYRSLRAAVEMRDARMVAVFRLAWFSDESFRRKRAALNLVGCHLLFPVTYMESWHQEPIMQELARQWGLQSFKLSTSSGLRVEIVHPDTPQRRGIHKIIYNTV